MKLPMSKSIAFVAEYEDGTKDYFGIDPLTLERG
jgi:hypothetical protein